MEDGQTKFARARTWFEANRKRLANGVLALLVVAVVVQIGTAVPRDTEVSLPLGNRHASVIEARLDYLQEDEAVRSITLRWPNGAPAQLRDTFSASPGAYDVELELVERDGRHRVLEGRLDAPADGVVRLAMVER